jgi:hypothetical protein
MGVFVDAAAECVHAGGMQGAVVIQSVLDCAVIAWRPARRPW